MQLADQQRDKYQRFLYNQRVERWINSHIHYEQFLHLQKLGGDEVNRARYRAYLKRLAKHRELEQ